MTAALIQFVAAASEPQSFVERNSDWLNALAIFVAALVLARLIDWVVARNFSRVSNRLSATELSQAALTRLRLVRRLLSVAIVLIGLGLALNQVDSLRPVATTLLASSAVVGIAVGLAARATLANAIAGVMLATVQPFRIGDVIQWQEHRGQVEDITLTYTFVRLASGHRLVIPNDALASSALENFSIIGTAVVADASVAVAPANATAGLALLRDGLPTASVALGDCQLDRAELRISFSTTATDEAADRVNTREQAVALLSHAGMLVGPTSQ